MTTRQRVLFHPYQHLIEEATQSQREATYQAWLGFVDWLEPEPPRNHRLVRHYRNADGELLVTLDEFIRALIDGDLQC